MSVAVENLSNGLDDYHVWRRVEFSAGYIVREFRQRALLSESGRSVFWHIDVHRFQRRVRYLSVCDSTRMPVNASSHVSRAPINAAWGFFGSVGLKNVG